MAIFNDDLREVWKSVVVTASHPSIGWNTANNPNHNIRTVVRVPKIKTRAFPLVNFTQ
jgi:hypothetical protein